MIKFKPEVINEVGENFVKAKGHLLRPARGPVVTAYGEQMSKGVTSKGIIIKPAARRRSFRLMTARLFLPDLSAVTAI